MPGPRQPVFKPDHVLAFLSGDENVERSVPVHVNQAHLIGRLIFVKTMFRKSTAPIILEPSEHARVLRARGDVGMTVAVDIAHRKAVRADQGVIQFVRRPLRRLEPRLLPGRVPGSRQSLHDRRRLCPQ